jgi:putative redox protein
MLEVIVNHLGAVQFEAKTRNHTIYCDQPVENGGFDEGMTPPEFLLASLGTCAGYYAVEYLRGRKLPLEGLRVRTTADKVKAPARLDNIHISLDYPAALDERHREGVLRAVHSCLIHNTLLHPPKIEVELVERGHAEMQHAIPAQPAPYSAAPLA